MLPKKASWVLCFAQESKGLPQKQVSRKALVQPNQPVLLNVDKWIIPMIARGGYGGAGSLLGTLFLKVTQHATLSA